MSGPDEDGGWDDVVHEGGDQGAEGAAAAEPVAAPAVPGGAPAARGAETELEPEGPEREAVIAEALRVAEDACREIMRCSGFDVHVLSVPGDPVRIELQGPDAGRIIGHHGATLQALQYIVARMVGHRVSRRVRVKVDVEGYRVRRENALRGLAQRAADRAVRERRTIELDPMNAEERRVVHIALADDGDVRTESVGEGEDRRVSIVPVDDEPDSGGPAAEPGDKADAGA